VTAWVALTGHRRVTAGDTVLTQGSGGVAVFALQFARVLGARVIATTSTAEKAERLEALGASDVINYTETPDWVSVAFRETVLAIVRERYTDFGPTLAAEKLHELHGLNLGVETLRQWMIGAGLWVRRKDRLKRIHQPRARRDCLGELVQIDGSDNSRY
jgi:hypothetical protein